MPDDRRCGTQERRTLCSNGICENLPFDPWLRLRSQKKNLKLPSPKKRCQRRRKKTFAKFSKKIYAEENGISNRQECPSFISPLTQSQRGRAEGAQNPFRQPPHGN